MPRKSNRVSKTSQNKNAWINTSSEEGDNIDNDTSDSDEIEEVDSKVVGLPAKPRPNKVTRLTVSGRGRPRDISNSTHNTRTVVTLPLTRDDLAVHKKKVDEVDAWLDQCFRPNRFEANGPNGRPTNGGQRMLLITGPTGAGKTATVKVLASSKQIHILEWINPMDAFVDSDAYNNFRQSQASRFEDFLMSSARYNSVIDPENAKKIILVEDFPNSFLLNPELFHNIIIKYQSMGKSPLVFIATEVSSGQKIINTLFPPPFIKQLNILHITFNPATNTSLMKALSHVIRVENRSDVSLEMQTDICNSCNGDIRNAILSLHYLSEVKPSSKVKVDIPVPKTRKRKTENTNKKISSLSANAAGIEGKDCLTGLMHSVGRVLYAKRQVSAIKGGGIDTDKRGFLKSDPQEIVNQFLSDCHQFVSLLHENYHSLFSDIHSAAKATEHICDSDILTSTWKERDLVKEIGFLVAVRGVMNASNNPIYRWNPLQKPKWKDTVLKADEHFRNMQHLYSKSSFSKRTLCMDFAPFVRSNIQGNSSSMLPEVLDLTPDSPALHITDEDSD